MKRILFASMMALALSCTREAPKPNAPFLLEFRMPEACKAEALRLIAADAELAASPLMRALAARGEGMAARFGQAVGALYYGIEEEEA